MTSFPSSPSGPVPSPLPLRGKRALVTGAGHRVGAAIARALGAAGMTVAVHYHQSREAAERTARDIHALGGQAALFAADLYDPNHARALVSDVLATFGGLDVLVPSAANFDRVDFDAIEPAHWQRALELNLLAPFALVHEARDALRKSRGAVVFITGYGTQTPYRGYLPYMVSKGATRQLMRTLAVELAPEVRVNAVAPGTVLPPPGMSDEEIAALAAETPLGRVGSAEDVGAAVAYLAAAPYVTGHELRVDGGRHLG